MNQIIRGVLILSLTLSAAPALSRDGAVVGAIIGAAIGNQVGNGSGKDAATAVGALVGAVVGDKVEREREREERRRVPDAPNPPRYDDRRNPTPPPRYEDRNPRRPNPPPVRPNPPPVRPSPPPNYPPPHYPPPHYPTPPPPPPPGHGNYNDAAFVPSVTRRAGGEWVRVTLDRPVTIDTLYVQPEFHGLRIHEAYLHNQFGQRIEVRSFWGLPTIFPGQFAYSERLNHVGRVYAIDLRIESMGGYANAWIRIQSHEGPSYPRVSR